MVDEDGNEQFLLRTVGGPHPGSRVVTNGKDNFTWPLPEALLCEGGTYVKTSESQLPAILDSQHVARGAEYKWQPLLPEKEKNNVSRG